MKLRFPFYCGGHHSRRAFTLIELLVVIAIVAILASLLFPAFNAAISRSSQARTLSNMRTIGVALNSYVADNQGQLPGPMSFAVFNYTTTNTTPGGTLAHMGAYLAPYVEQRPAPWLGSGYVHLPAFECPPLSAAARTNVSVAQFVRLDYLPDSGDNIFGASPSVPSLKGAEETTPKPKRVVALTDKARRSAILTTADQLSWLSAQNGLLPKNGLFSGKRLYLFVDGSVEGPIFKPVGTWTR